MDIKPITVSDALEILEAAETEEEKLAVEKSLIKQTDNRPRDDDGPQPEVDKSRKRKTTFGFKAYKENDTDAVGG